MRSRSPRPGDSCSRGSATSSTAGRWGRWHELPWAVVHPAVDGLSRHPVALYGALGEGLLLWAVLSAFPYPRFGIGSRAAAACIAYGLIRIVVEVFKAPESEPGIVATGMAYGQLYSLVLMVSGIALAIRIFAATNRRR